MSFVDDFENTVLNAVLGASAVHLPSPVYIGLSTTTPNDDGTGFTEPGAGGYARVLVNNNGSNWPAAVAGEKSNGIAVVFPTATGAWGTITYFGIFTAVSGGLPKIVGPLDTPRAIANTDQFRFQATKLVVSLD